MSLSIDQTVRFRPATNAEFISGVIVRVWANPVGDPYVTIRDNAGRTFVRFSSRVCIGITDHVFTMKIGEHYVIARHAIDSDPAALLPCFDYAVIGSSGKVVAYVIANEMTGAAPYDIFSATGKMRYLETRTGFAEAVGRGWLEAI
jgi:hypothetical protein